MNSAWLRYQPDAERLTLQIHAQPNAKSTGATGFHGDALKIRIAAPAADDKANAALLSWLADALGIARNTLRIRSGATSRRKVVEVHPADRNTAARAAALGAQ